MASVDRISVVGTTADSAAITVKTVSTQPSIEGPNPEISKNNTLPPTSVFKTFINYLNPFYWRDRLLYPASQRNHIFDHAELSRAIPHYQTIRVQAKDGQVNPMIWAANTSPQANGYTKVFLHGNAGDLCSSTQEAIQAYQAGYNICLTTYRGYSNNQTGKPSQEGLIQDILAVFEELIDKRKINSQTIDIEAHSLGAAVAIQALYHRSKQKNPDYYHMTQNLQAQSMTEVEQHQFTHKVLCFAIKEQFNTVTLYAPFASLESLSQHLTGFKYLPEFVRKYLCNNEWNTLGILPQLPAYKYLRIIHGEKDTLIPPSESQKLMDYLQGRVPCDRIVLPNKDHNDIYALVANPHPDEVLCGLPYNPQQHCYPHTSNAITHTAENNAEHAVDIAMPMGAEIKAVSSGTVIAVEESIPDLALTEFSLPVKGETMASKPVNYILVQDEKQRIYTYMHIQSRSSKIKVGAKIAAGDVIAQCGHNGYSTAPHLHLAVNDAQGKSLPIRFATCVLK